MNVIFLIIVGVIAILGIIGQKKDIENRKKNLENVHNLTYQEKGEGMIGQGYDIMRRTFRKNN